MKPFDWQIHEALEHLLRSPEFRHVAELPLSEVLKKVGLIILDDIIRTLDRGESDAEMLAKETKKKEVRQRK